MAIAFDNATSSQANSVVGGVSTFSHVTGSGTNRILVLGVQIQTGTNITGTPTYNGVSMTLINTYSIGGAVFNSTYLYYVLNPANGSNTVSISAASGGFDMYASVATYTGVAQTSPIDVNGFATPTTGTSLSEAVTTTVDKDWLVGFFSGGQTGAALSAGANTTFRTTVTGGFWNNIGDSNAPQSPAGSYSLAVSAGGSERLGVTVAALKPAPVTTNGNFLVFM